eukprot:s843_g4.t1
MATFLCNLSLPPGLGHGTEDQRRDEHRFGFQQDRGRGCQGLGAKALAEALKMNTSVANINLEHNKIGSEGAEALAEALKINQSALAEALKMNRSVTKIDLVFNNIGAEGAKALAEALKMNTSVTNIDLGWNYIDDEGAKAWCPEGGVGGAKEEGRSFFILILRLLLWNYVKPGVASLDWRRLVSQPPALANDAVWSHSLPCLGARGFRMPFGAWTEEDWRLRDRRQPGPYLIHDEASTPSDVLLQAKAEARRMRSTVSLSKASLPGKALSRGGPSLGSTHFSSRMHNSSTSIGEVQDSVDTVQTLVSPFSSVDDDSELLLEHSEMILQHWKKEGQPKLWLVDKILGSPKSDASLLTFDDGMDHAVTSASMVLFKVENDVLGTGAKEEEQKFTVSDAVQLIAGGTVIGAVAEDMLRKLKNTGPRSGLSRSYIETCERFGKLADKVKEVFEQMEEIAKFEVEKANLRVKLRGGDVNAGAMAKALGREGDQDLIAKISAASEQDDDDDQIDGKEKLISEIETMLTRNDLAILLKEVLGVLETFKWQDMATEFRKWIFQSDSSENVVRRVIDESVELHRDAIGVLTLSKFLADETLSSHLLLAARPIEPTTGPRISGAVAFGAAVDRNAIVAGLELTQVCARRICEVRRGRVVFSQTAFHQMEPGHAFLINIGHVRSTAAPCLGLTVDPPFFFWSDAPLPSTDMSKVVDPLVLPPRLVLSMSCPGQLCDPPSLQAVSISFGRCVMSQEIVPALNRGSKKADESRLCPVLSFANQCKLNDQPDREGSMPDRTPPALQPVPPPTGHIQPIVLPAFIHDMFLDLPEEFMQADIFTRGFVVRTWYIHHRTIQRNRVFRCVHLCGPPNVWQAQLLTVWFDILIPLEAVDIDLVKPRPSRTRDERLFAFDLILSQGLEVDRFPGLITVTPSMQNPVFPRYAMAISLPPEVSGLTIIGMMAFQQVCRTYQCFVFHRWNQLTLAATPIHFMQPGDSFEVSVFTRVTASGESSTSGAAPASASDAQQGPVDMNCSSDSPEPSLEPSTSSEAPGPSPAPPSVEDTVSTQHRQVHLYRLGRPSISIRLHWPLVGDLIDEVAVQLGVGSVEIFAIHPLQSKPEAKPLQDLSFIVQMRNDLPLGSTEQLLLFDVVIHQHGQVVSVPAPTFNDRRVVKTQNLIARVHVLEYAHLTDFCQLVSNRCVVTKNRFLWQLQDITLHHMSHGMYIQLIVPPPRTRDVPVLQAIQTVEDFGYVSPGRSFADHYPAWQPYLLPSPDVQNQEDVAAASKVVGCAHTSDSPPLHLVEHANDDQMQEPPDFLRSPGPDQLMPPAALQMPPLHELQAFLVAFGCTFRDRAEVAFADQGPVIHVQTWYVHHDQHPRCRHAVTVELEADPATWPETLISPWRHLIQLGVPLAFREVRPNPPRLFRERHMVHVILEQGLHRPFVAGLASVLIQGLYHDGTAQIAISLPQRVSAEDIIRQLQLETRCLVYRCSVWSGVQMFQPALAEEIFSGIGIYLHIHSHDCRHMLRDYGDQPFWHVGAFDATASSSSSILPRRTPLYQPPGYSRSLQVLQEVDDHNAHSSGSFKPDLTTAWHLYLAQTPQGPYRFQVISWFCDHVRLPRSNEGCLVTLSVDPNTWSNTLRAAWSDWVLPGIELDFYLVRPTPLGPDPVVGHVILAQNQLPRFVSVLISSTLPGENAWDPVHRVVRLPVVVDHFMLIQEGGLMNMCPPMTFGLDCRSWIDAQELTDGHLYLASSGDGFLTVASELPSDLLAASAPTLKRIYGLFARISDILTALTTQVVQVMESNSFGLPFSPSDGSLFLDPSMQAPVVLQAPTLTTWFLHFEHQRTCYQSRQITVSADLDFHDHFRLAWRDKCGEEISISYFWLDQESVLGAALDPLSDEQAVLAESRFSAEGTCSTSFRATFVPAWMSPMIIRSIFGLPADSNDVPQLQHCRYFLHEAPLSETSHIQVRHGDRLLITCCQQDLARHCIKVDFDSVLRAHEYLDCYFFLPTYDLPSSFPWHPSSWAWVSESEWWHPGIPVSALRFYYDGSSLPQAQDKPAGCAVAAFVLTSGGWQFAGAISSALQAGTGSYSAELYAAIAAHKFLHDLLKLIAVAQFDLPYVEMCYDSETVGHQASGEWQTFSQPIMGQFLRSLHRVIESKLACSVIHRHVTAHTGEPGNELVDTLAFQAALGHPLHDFKAWFDHVLCKAIVDASEWIWYLFRPDICWEGSHILFPAGPVTAPSVEVFPSQLAQNCTLAEDAHGVLDTKFATCNVLSLLPSAKQRAHGPVEVCVGPARQESLLQQFHEAGVHIFAWQETRLRQMPHRHDDRYWLYRSQANAYGQYGMLVGLHRTLPIGTLERPGLPVQPVYLSDHEVAIIEASPRLLILRLSNPVLKCIIIAGHAPHTGAGETHIQRWWTDLADMIPSQYRTWDFVLLTDANAHVGSEPCDAIGDHQAEECDPRSEGFTNFIRQHGLWIPATFAHCHQGPGVTWRHARGTWSRNDYVCLPGAWKLEACTSWISEDIDASLAKEDHRRAVVHVRRHLVPFPSLQRHRSGKLAFDQLDPSALQYVACPNWNFDVHTHCHMLQKSIVASLWNQRSLPKRRPKRQTMSDTTWQLVQEKKNSSFDSLLSQQDQLIALAYHDFRCLGRRVTKALKYDDIGFFSSLLSECSDFLHPSQAKDLWEIVRRSLPKFQQRRLASKPCQLAALDDQWLPHYCELEAGVQIDPGTLLNDCVWSQARGRLDAPLQIALQDLPSLTHLEQTFRSTSAGKSTGHDVLPSALFHRAAKELALLHHDLIVKTYLWQSEPIQAKGGPVAMIPKVLSPEFAKQFRGILLLPSAGKRAHAILRRQIMSVLWPVRSQGQMGGFPAQQVIFGSHAIRTFGVLCDTQGLSSAILFLDLSSAFHHLIREVVVGSVDGSNLAPVLDVLAQSRNPIDSFKQFEQLPGLLEDMGVPVPVVRLLRDMHLGTWCSLHDKWLLRTHRGTRPGSPLADIIFHTLMARVAHSLDKWLGEQSAYQRLLRHLDVEVPSVIWADDIAVPLATHHADQLMPFLRAALQQARDALLSYGFSLNMAKGKTSAVLTFRGPGASELRKEYQLHANAGITCQFSDGQEVRLFLVPVYRHLGTLFASNHNLACELRARVGIAKSTFAKLSKPILTNRSLPARIRLQMFQSLVLSKMFFGLGAWVTPSPKQLAYFQSALAQMLKRVLRIGTEHVPVAQVLQRAGIADIRSRLAVERLLYAQRLFRTGPVFVQNLVQKEFEATQGSWFHGLRADLQWLEGVIPNCLPGQWQTDMTPLFDHWQVAPSPWDSLVKRAWRVHVHQNGIMSDARKLHGAAFRTLKGAGASFPPATLDWDGCEESFTCFCNKTFASKRGLLAHQRKAHAIFSVERQFLQGCTCLHCGKYLWTTQRLQQHLAYIPKKLGYNPCFQALQEQARQVPYDRAGPECVGLFAGLPRREALVTQGPQCDPTPVVERQLIRLLFELDSCKANLQFPFQPADPLSFGAKIGDLLSHVTRRCFESHVDFEEPDRIRAPLVDAWIDVLYAGGQESDEDLDPWLEFVFLTWGEHWLPDVLDSFEDGVLAREIDEAFAEFASQLDRYQTLARIAHLEHAIQLCQRTAPEPHRPVNCGALVKHPKVSSKVQQAVPRPFAEQTQWQQEVRAMRFLDLPVDQSVPKLKLDDGREVFLVVHLFSGRRRKYDIHHHLHDLSGARGLAILVLSLDTAVSLEYGNLALAAPSWRWLCQAYQAGVVAATVIGSPCETFSEARFMEPPEGVGAGRWPRPLRSADRIFGLEGLTMRELRQCHMGGNFFQQGALTLSFHMAHGGFFISEHPAKPADPQRPSIWTSALLSVLMQHPEAQLSTVPQFLWGATAVKPTGLLHFRLPHFCRDLYSQADPHAVRPQVAAIGRDEAGNFRTAQHKEYPDRFCCGIATALVRALAHHERSGRYRVVDPASAPLTSWILEAAQNLADFHEAIDREMKLMLEKFGLDDSITLRMLTDAKSQMLVEGYSTQKSGVLDELQVPQETASGRGSRNSMVPGFNPAELTEEQKAMVYERDTQRRNHKRIMSDLYALVQEHKRKVELSRSLHDHMMMTTMRTAAPQGSSRPPSGQDGQSYLRVAMAKKEADPQMELPDLEDSASDVNGADGDGPRSPASAAGSAASPSAVHRAGASKEALPTAARRRRKSVTAGRWSVKKDDKTPAERHKDPAHRNARPHFEVGAIRLLQSAKAAVDDIIAKSAERSVLEESALKYLKKLEMMRRKVKNSVSQLRSLKLKPKGSVNDLDLTTSPSMTSLRGSSSSIVSNRATHKPGEAPNELQFLRMRRDWLNKDLNEKVVKVSLQAAKIHTCPALASYTNESGRNVFGYQRLRYAGSCPTAAAASCAMLDRARPLLQQVQNGEISFVVKTISLYEFAKSFRNAIEAKTKDSLIAEDVNTLRLAGVTSTHLRADNFNRSLAGVTFPSSLQTLSFGSKFNQRLADVALPISLRTLTFGADFNQSMAVVTLPSSLQTLTFGRKFNQSMADTLTFGWEFNHSLAGVTLPSSLLTLTLGNKFNQSLEFDRYHIAKEPAELDIWLELQSEFVRRVTLPSSLQTLTLGDQFNQSLTGITLPDSLRTLTFGENFNQSLTGIALPSSLQTLSFGGSYDKRCRTAKQLAELDRVALPSSLQTLTFGQKFNQSLAGIALPSSLQSLTFGQKFNQSLAGIALPSSLQSLTFGQKFNQSLAGIALPSNLRSLIFGNDFNQSHADVTLPSSLQNLTVGKKYRSFSGITFIEAV